MLHMTTQAERLRALKAEGRLIRDAMASDALIKPRDRTFWQKAGETWQGLLGLAFSVFAAFVFLKVIWIIVMVL